MNKLFTLKKLDYKGSLKLLSKLALSLLLIVSSFIAGAQTKDELAKIRLSVNTASTAVLKDKFNKTYQEDERKVAAYLAKHPGVKRSFDSNSSFYWLKTIDAMGNPVYINTKNRESGQLIKADQLYSGGSLGVNITGTGMVAGIWDGGQVRATHELLAGQVAMEPGQTLDGSGSNYKGNNHQTHVSGTMVGKDIANQPSARGIAFSATAKNYDFLNDLAEMTTFATGGYLISNHSYGGSNDNTTPLWKFGAYDSEALDWDELTKNAPSYLPFVAAGNEQQSSGNPAKAGYDIMTGSAAAKNVMTVGAVNGDMTMSDYSNWGPTDDGRVKPDIVAKGTGINSSYFADPVTNLPSDNSYSGNGVGSSGTSYSSPAAAASGLLLQQYYNSLYSTFLKASTLKGLMLNTATDLGQPGPDPKFGWGLLNIEKAARMIKYKTAAGNSSASSNTNTNTLSYAYIEEITFNPAANSSDEGSRDVVASGCEPLIISMSWTDDEGTEQTLANGVDPIGTRLVYDFDFMVRNTGTGVDVRPWKPVSMANRLNNASTCTTWFDVNYNNFKQVVIQNPTAGQTYRIYFRKKTGSPATPRIISLIVSGLRVLPPTGAASQSFCTASTIANLVVIGTGVKWYDAATAGNLLPSNTALVTGTIYYASQTIEGCTSTTRLAVTVTAGSTAAPTGNASQSFCTASTVANLTATGTAIKWYDAATAGNLLPSATALTNGTIYYASQTVGSCESASRFAVTVTIAATAAPTGNASQSFCTASTVANLTATGTAIKWYDAATAGNLLPSATALSNGTIYYASQTVGGCESATRFAVTVTIGATAAPTGNASQSFCGAATVANLAATGTAIKWYDAATAGNLLPSATALINGTIYYASQTVGGCESANRLAVTVTLTAAPNAIINYTGSPYCSNAGTATVSQSGTSGGTYSATPAGLTINVTTGAITLATSTAGTYTVTYTVAASGGCNATITTATITITAAPAATIVYANSPYCSNGGTANVTRTGTAGGTYSSTAGLTINATTGAVTLGASTPGTYTVTYNVAATAGCGSFTTSTNISIAALPTASISYSASPYCQNAGLATVVRTGAAGGTYSSTAGLIINATTGEVTLATSTAGTYTVTYTIAAGSGCAAVTATTTITITTLPTATISYAGSPYCNGSGTANVTRTGAAGGTYSSAAGLIINATTGAVNLTTSTAGTYTVSYTLAAAGGCNAVTATSTIIINSLSVAATGATVSAANICGPSTVTLSVTGGSLGSGASWKWYSATCGGTLVGTGASINVTINATTTYFVRAEGICNTTTCASVIATVNTQPTITIAASPYTSLMPAQSTTLTATVTPVLTGNTIAWYKNGNIVSGANSSTLSGITVDQLGTYTASITTANGCTVLSAPLVIKDSVTDKLFVYPNPTNGKFKIRYYSSRQSFGFLRTVTVYNSFGERVYLKKLPVTGAYSSMDIDISNAGRGLFILVVSDFYGTRLVTSKIEVL